MKRKDETNKPKNETPNEVGQRTNGALESVCCSLPSPPPLFIKYRAVVAQVLKERPHKNTAVDAVRRKLLASGARGPVGATLGTAAPQNRNKNAACEPGRHRLAFAAGREDDQAGKPDVVEDAGAVAAVQHNQRDTGAARPK